MKKATGNPATTTTVYIFSGTKVIAEYVNGSLSKEYIYSGSALLATHDGATLRYHHRDHLGTRVDSDGTGNWTRKFGHFPFGESWYEDVQGGGAASKLKFTSYERDSESGLDQAMFRYDSPRLGRFTSPDPMAGRLPNPQSLNRYAYVLNDPINFVDPLGLEQDECKWECGEKGCTLTCPYKIPPPLLPPLGDATRGSGPSPFEDFWGWLYGTGALYFDLNITLDEIGSFFDTHRQPGESFIDCTNRLANQVSPAGLVDAAAGTNSQENPFVDAFSGNEFTGYAQLGEDAYESNSQGVQDFFVGEGISRGGEMGATESLSKPANYTTIFPKRGAKPYVVPGVKSAAAKAALSKVNVVKQAGDAGAAVGAAANCANPSRSPGG